MQSSTVGLLVHVKGASFWNSMALATCLPVFLLKSLKLMGSRDLAKNSGNPSQTDWKEATSTFIEFWHSQMDELFPEDAKKWFACVSKSEEGGGKQKDTFYSNQLRLLTTYYSRRISKLDQRSSCCMWKVTGEGLK